MGSLIIDMSPDSVVLEDIKDIMNVVTEGFVKV
ncbi:MAG: hypothetical protein A4E23_00131 [Methanomethylovorans sp. PtaU1.Bin073]|nr:MAG: hypothetical protein A4E23_00131 [Methanomethylovorans sp. PtaU1.Bin073]